MVTRTSTTTRTASQCQLLPVEQMDPTTFLPLCDCLEDEGSTMFIFPLCEFVLRLDHCDLLFCKT